MSTNESSDPVEEMSRENDVKQKLVERLAEDGLSLSSGNPAPRSDILEGLNLLTYYEELHAARFRSVLEPEARAVAMASCFEHLDAIGRELVASNERLAQVRSALEAYREGNAGATLRLASGLDDLTQAAADAIRYEEDYPLSCLRMALPEDATQRVHAGFGRTAAETANLEADIDRYLHQEPCATRPVHSVHCHQPGCRARGVAESYPAAGGRLGLRAPSGWKTRAGSPRSASKSLVVIDVDFWCPDHPQIEKAPIA
ncbi:MAG: hypothetical protein ACREDK_07825 [Thermoplasmata archaeon]